MANHLYDVKVRGASDVKRENKNKKTIQNKWKRLKQDLVGFHWSAFFEPRLPFTGVPVKKKKKKIE